MKQKNMIFGTAIAALILAACTGRTTGTATSSGSDYEIPDSVKVPVAEARLMVANYGPRAGFVIQQGDSLPDTRAAWFSRERLEALVKLLREENGDGIRFYYATYNNAYPDSIPGVHIPEQDYWGRNTLLMVSTRENAGDGHIIHEDYFTEDPAHVGTKGIVLAADIENDASMCPPRKGCEGTKLLDEPTP